MEDKRKDDLFNAQVEVAAEKRVRELLEDDRFVMAQLARRNILLSEKLEKTEDELEALAADLTRLMDASGNYAMKDAAKLLKFRRADGKQVGRTELFAFLRDVQFLNRDNTPAQSGIDRAWFDEITGTYVVKGVENVYVKTVVTPKGLERIRRLMEDAFDDWWENGR